MSANSPRRFLYPLVLWMTFSSVALNVHKARKEQDDRDATHRSQINTLSSLTDQLRGPHSQRPSEAEVDRQLLLVGLKPRSAGAESQTTPDPAQHLSWKDAWKARPAPPVEPSSSGTSSEGASSAVPAPIQATSQQPEKHWTAPPVADRVDEPEDSRPHHDNVKTQPVSPKKFFIS